MKRLNCIVGLCLLIAGCDLASHESVETWRFAIEESEGSVQHSYAVKFKELVEDRTAGAVKVVVYPYGTLGTSTQVTEQLNMGIVEFAMASPGSLGKFIPEMQVFLLHFLFPEDPQELRGLLTDAEFIAEFDQLYERKGLKLLSIFSEGQMVWTTRDEIRRPADFDGVKMRVMTSPLLLAAYDAYGASPTPMPYSEVYSGLQLRMIDGQVNPVFAIERQKFHEVTSWMIFPRHASFITTCAANRQFHQNLPPSERQIVHDVMAELDQYIHETQINSQIERLKEILRDKRRQRATLHIVGDLEWFLSSLTSTERASLIDDNEYLELHPALTADERRAFLDASQEVRDVYLRIGGKRADEMLSHLLTERGGGQ